MQVCSKCGAETEFKKGISQKTNKPWSGYKCLDSNCGNMDFVRDKPKAQLPQDNTVVNVMFNTIIELLKKIEKNTRKETQETEIPPEF
jgi:hypothetical protein